MVLSRGSFSLSCECVRPTKMLSAMMPLPETVSYIQMLHCLGAPYLKLLSGFKKLFPDIDPIPLIATVCFYTPVVRDFCSWCGVRQVCTGISRITLSLSCLSPSQTWLRLPQLSVCSLFALRG